MVEGAVGLEEAAVAEAVVAAVGMEAEGKEAEETGAAARVVEAMEAAEAAAAEVVGVEGAMDSGRREGCCYMAVQDTTHIPVGGSFPSNAKGSDRARTRGTRLHPTKCYAKQDKIPNRIGAVCYSFVSDQ